MAAADKFSRFGDKRKIVSALLYSHCSTVIVAAWLCRCQILKVMMSM